MAAVSGAFGALSRPLGRDPLARRVRPTGALAPRASAAPLPAPTRLPRQVGDDVKAPVLFRRLEHPRVAGGSRASLTHVARAVVAPNPMDDIDFDADDEMYTWRVGGANDIPIRHLRDVYRGEEPLVAIPSPFCTSSSCPVRGVGDRTQLNLNRVFVSEDDRVLLRSIAFGCALHPATRRPQVSLSFGFKGISFLLTTRS